MSAARTLANFGNQSTLNVDTTNTEVGIASAIPSSTLDVRGEVKIGTAIQAGVAGVLTATSFSGSGANLTDVSASTDYIVSVATTTGNLNVSAAATITGAVDANATTDSTSSTTGALTAAGGVGIAKDLFVGDAIDVTKDLKVGAAATITGAVNIDATTDSTSTSTGALIVDGGLAVAKNVYIGAGLSVAGTLTYEDVTSVDSVGMVTAKSGVNVSGGELNVGLGFSVGNAGVATFSGTADVHLKDNVQLKVGDGGSDFYMYHDGSNTHVKNDTGKLLLNTSANQFGVLHGSDDAIISKVDGAVELYFDNSKKWETTNDGAVTTGIATATVGIDAAISVWTLGANSTNHYTFTGPGNLSATDDPTLNLKRGQKYTFKNRSGGHPFRIQSTPNGSWQHGWCDVY